MEVIEFQLPCGSVAKVSACDVGLVSSRRWFRNDSNRSSRLSYVVGYRSGGTGKRDSLHRLILGHLAGSSHIDHINGDGLDNRRENLRVATPSQNLHNSQLSLRNKSGFKGVAGPFASKRRGDRWTSTIGLGYRSVYLGIFDSAVQAAVAYDIAALALFGDHASTNLSLGLLPAEMKEEVMSKVVGIKLPDHEFRRWAELADKDRLTVPKWVRKQVAIAAKSVGHTPQVNPNPAPVHTEAGQPMDVIHARTGESVPVADLPKIKANASQMPKSNPSFPEGHSFKCTCKKCNEARGWR